MYILNSDVSVKEYSALIRKQLHSVIRVSSTTMLPITWQSNSVTHKM